MHNNPNESRATPAGANLPAIATERTQEPPEVFPAQTNAATAAAVTNLATEDISSASEAETDLDPGGEPIQRVGGGFIAIYMFTYFGFNLVMLMPALFSLAYKVQVLDPDGKDASLGLVVGLGGAIGLIAGPVAGVLSDGTRLRWGRRRPWLVTGLLISLLGGLVLAIAPSIPVMLAGWAMCTLGIAGLSAGWNPILAERVPSAQRGRIGALGGVAASLAGVGASLIGSFLTGNMFLLFLLPPAVLALGVIVFIAAVKDNPAPAGTQTPSLKQLFASFWFNPLRYSDFALVFLGKFLIQFGFTFFSTYQLYFLLDRLGFTPEQAGQNLALAGGLSLLALMAFAVAGGFLSDRLKRRKPFIYTAALLIAAGLTTVSFAPSLELFIIGGVLLSAGTGAFTSVDLAMATDLLPEKDKAGKYMSIYYLASGLPGPIAASIAPAIIGTAGGGNYGGLFISGAVFTLGTIITTVRIRAVR